MPARPWWSILLLFAHVAVAVTVAGCMMREDIEPGITFWNQTSAEVDVSYRRIFGTAETETLVMTIAPNQRVTIPGLLQAEGECARGTLIATHEGQTIATLSKPCRGATWVITEPGASVP